MWAYFNHLAISYYYGSWLLKNILRAQIELKYANLQ